MKVSLQVLNNFIDISDLSPEIIADKLTFAGVKVESIDEFAYGTNLTVGQIKEVEMMEGSDHLHLCLVDCGEKIGILHIVCGAPNVNINQKVIVALDGAILKDTKIKKGQIRGHLSEGMLCSLVELGIDTKYLSEEEINGIEILPEDTPIGIDNVLKYLHLKHTVLDLELLANRSDLYSLINVAKEIGTLFNRPLKESKLPTFKRLSDDFEILSLTDKCPQFAISMIKNVHLAPSPNSLRFALNAMGIRAINNIVDIGNYVMLLTGQPIHMYDVDKLNGHQLVVKDNLKTTFKGLDEQTYQIQEGDICVTNHDEVMCLGGVFGAYQCAIDETTKNVAIEAANFFHASIRKTATRLGLNSDSSQRFIKGINPHQTTFVLDLIAVLVRDLCFTEEIYQIHNYDALKHENVKIKFAYQNINALLNTNFSLDEIKEYLRRDYIAIQDDEAIIPLWRLDLKEECDLAEEVIRIAGFDFIKSKLPITPSNRGFYHAESAFNQKTRQHFINVGIDEVLTYTLVNEKEKDLYNYLNLLSAPKILNPLTEDHSYVRQNLLLSLINVASYNYRHNYLKGKIFEVSDLYNFNDFKESHLGVLLYGQRELQGLLKEENYSFYDVKGLLEGYLTALGIALTRIKYIALPKEDTNFHPYRSAYVYLDNKLFAILGEMNELKKKEFGFLEKTPVVLLEANLTMLRGLKVNPLKAPELNKYPSVNRDYAFMVPNNISYNDIFNIINKIDRSLIKEINVFDVYHSDKFIDQYSLALSIQYASSLKTLDDNDILPIEEKIYLGLKKIGVSLRK